MSEIFDLAIIGGGPAGVAGGVYASRKRLKTVFITESFESQSSTSEEIQNWIGTTKISGADLTKNLENHLRTYAENIVDIRVKEKAEMVTLCHPCEGRDPSPLFEIKTKKGIYQTRTVLVTTGANRKKLEVPGAEKYDGKGIVYCATCDGPLFADKDVVVIGGGNSAFETALQLLAYCKSVTLLNRRDEFRADPITVKKAMLDPKMKVITTALPQEIKGDKFVTSIIYKNKEGQNVELATEGVFVEIGHIPSTSFVKDLVALDAQGHVITDPKTQQASVKGIWAAGDCTDGLYAQNNIAVGDAVKAIEDIYRYLKN
jgi:alkyl hydroperoxide reductase subunit F